MQQLETQARPFFSIRELPKRLLSISLKEATFACRGFRGSEGPARLRLERIGITFLSGYHAAIENPGPLALAEQLNSTDRELRGFAFEGAAMGLALLDMLTPWKRDRWSSFFCHVAQAHWYMAHVGAGWALARLQRWVRTSPAGFDPLLHWLALDGYGFHEGYFYWKKYIDGHTLPRQLSGYARRAFDQGLGRSLWFVEGAEVERLPLTIKGFDPSRQGDLWSGVGLACAYAGGVCLDGIEKLRIAARSFHSHLAQGAAFAALARQKAGNPAPHTDEACAVLCDVTAEAAAQFTEAAAKDLRDEGDVPAYEIWRQRIQSNFI
jgi:hypothetical protein